MDTGEMTRADPPRGSRHSHGTLTPAAPQQRAGGVLDPPPDQPTPADGGPGARPAHTRLTLATGRVEAFSDGVFAVAITLLVFGITTPHARAGHLAQGLLAQWPAYATYAVSFLTIGIIRVNHHGTFARIARVDRPLLFINLLLLMAVSFIPFPTSLMSQYVAAGAAARQLLNAGHALRALVRDSQKAAPLSQEARR
jgi:hypothetical protein